MSVLYRYLAVFFVVFSTVALVPNEAFASGRDYCVNLAIGISVVDDNLDGAGVQFDDLGQFLGAAKASEGTPGGLFDQLNQALGAAVDITFRDSNQFLSEVSKCDLVGHVIDVIND